MRKVSKIDVLREFAAAGNRYEGDLIDFEHRLRMFAERRGYDMRAWGNRAQNNSLEGGAAYTRKLVNENADIWRLVGKIESPGHGRPRQKQSNSFDPDTDFYADDFDSREWGGRKPSFRSKKQNTSSQRNSFSSGCWNDSSDSWNASSGREKKGINWGLVAGVLVLLFVLSTIKENLSLPSLSPKLLLVLIPIGVVVLVKKNGLPKVGPGLYLLLLLILLVVLYTTVGPALYARIVNADFVKLATILFCILATKPLLTNKNLNLNMPMRIFILCVIWIAALGYNT